MLLVGTGLSGGSLRTLLEETACRTRAILEQMQGSGCSLSIATKSDLVLRDLDLIKTFPNARVSWSIKHTGRRFSR